MREIEEKLINEIIKVKGEVQNKTVKYIVAALGLVAGLAWNDAIKAFIEYFFPQDENSLKAKIIYALFITTVVAVASFYLSALEKKEEKKNEDASKKEEKKDDVKKTEKNSETKTSKTQKKK